MEHLFLADVRFWRIGIVSLLLVQLALLSTVNGQYKGRNVCARNKYSVRPVHQRQTFRRAVETPDLKRCALEREDPCNRTTIGYKTMTRTVVRMRLHREKVPGCCPGWKKRSPYDISCLIPECSRGCLNGGRCVGPESCMCAEGYMGRYCHVDIDECAGKNECQQKCINRPGTYECACVDGFSLAEDQTSCDLCLSCNKEFQDLQAEVVSMPEKMEQRAEETRRNTQADMMQEIKRQAETFEKLQSQYEAIVVIQKQMAVIPEINARLDNLTELRTEVHELRALETQVRSLEDKLEDGLASLKNSDTDLSAALQLAVQRWEGRAPENQSPNYGSALDRLLEKQDRMQAKIEYLEEETEKARADLASARTYYMHASRQRTAVATTQQPDTYSDTAFQLASLSKQISLLEEKMAECQCKPNPDQVYYKK
ncbi:epidermal growth factor protein 7 [Plakobranchus ocellatus]|uniref:Epidermal growth factor protein 7 n=1 Tax=Plakobranchus ocellatus TaxID=259542 RepID=A0AAV4AJX7_9GAST|nr:epidermal growth factor protein 7 [Plakobranchus ocellatus]